MNTAIRAQRAYLKGVSRGWSEKMEAVPPGDWPPSLMGLPHSPLVVYRSRRFLAQQFAAENGAVRLSVNRCAVDDYGQWVDGLTWDDLQRVKSECGFGHLWAVEIFPPDNEIVNAANLRHLWLLPDPPQYVWRRLS